MDKLVSFALQQRILMVLFLAVMLIVGTIAFINLNIEAYPDPVPPLVEVITQSGGQSAEEMERYITIPIEVQLAGIPNVTAIRSISLFGLSDIKLQFSYDFTYDEAVQRVMNQLSQLSALPNGAQPGISPTSPIGEIIRYRVVGPPGYSVTDLKTLQDWVLQRRFKAIPGVIDVTGWGGQTKAYEISIDQNKLVSHGLTIPQVLQALGNANVNVGGQTVNFGPQSAVVRGVGQIHSLDDIRNTVLSSNGGSPLLVQDVATVTVGHEPRLGIAGQDQDDDIVQGVVLMRRGAESMPTITRVEAEMERINSNNILPPGVSIKRIYDRSELIKLTTHTVLHNMAEGILLIFIVQWVFLGNLRSAVIVALTIPFALFFAILIMMARGESANLLSVGAIDFGLIVDTTVIMVENIIRHLVEAGDHRPPGSPSLYGKLPLSLQPYFAPIANAAGQVSQSIFFAAAIIIAAFLPLFTLSGVEGHIFGPMAKTYAYALAGGLLATFTVTPALSALMLPGRVEETETITVRWLRKIYEPALDFALSNRVLTLGGTGMLLLVAMLAMSRLGLEFLPHLEEGNMWIRASMPPSISLEEGNGYVNEIRKALYKRPEVVTVISQHGRPDDGTDATGFFNAEFFVPLKPFDTWPKGMNKEKMTAELTSQFQDQFPGIEFNFSQYIQDNVEEAASGVKGENSVKLYGSDLEELERVAEQIKNAMATVPGVTDLAVFDALGQPTVKITIDRLKAARYGLAPGDINATVQAAIGGQSAGNLYQDGSDRFFPMLVRFSPEYRTSLDAIRRISIGAPNPEGNGIVPIPLEDLADVRLVSGASFIYREGQQRFIPIKFSVRGRDLGGAVLEAQKKVMKDVPLPSGYQLEWAGEFGNLQDATKRLSIAVPVALALIFLLLYINYGTVGNALLAGSVIPMALIGGILTLYVTGTPFSVSAAIGFVALFGISVTNGIIILSCYNGLIEAGSERFAAVREACRLQLRPVMMTCVAACVGLLPATLSSGIGSQVQKPLALVVVGGITVAPILIMLALPVLIEMFGISSAQGPGE